MCYFPQILEAQRAPFVVSFRAHRGENPKKEAKKSAFSQKRPFFMSYYTVLYSFYTDLGQNGCFLEPKSRDSQWREGSK